MQPNLVIPPAAEWPKGTPIMLQAGKNRTQPAGFRATDPRRGFMYTEKVGTDNPVTWDFSIVLDTAQAIRFALWVDTEINGGADEFMLPIKTEFGLIPHRCRFLTGFTTTEVGETWHYSGQIQSRAQVVPKEYQDASGFIIANPDPEGAASLLDLSMDEAPQ